MKPKKKNRMLTDLARFGHGFVYAWHGICAAVLEERNFRFHLCAALYVFAAAHMAHIDATGVALLAIAVITWRASGKMSYAYLVAGFTLMIVLDGGEQGIEDMVEHRRTQAMR